MHCTFEPGIQWDCVRSIIQLLRDDSDSRERALQIAQHAACFIGCGAKLMEGSDDDIIGASSPGDLVLSGMTDFELADRLEATCPTEGTAAFDWETLLDIVIPVLLELLRRWR